MMALMALTPKRLFISLCISISLLRPYTFFSRSPLVFKTLFENKQRLCFDQYSVFKVGRRLGLLQ